MVPCHTEFCHVTNQGAKISPAEDTMLGLSFVSQFRGRLSAFGQVMNSWGGVPKFFPSLGTPHLGPISLYCSFRVRESRDVQHALRCKSNGSKGPTFSMQFASLAALIRPGLVVGMMKGIWQRRACSPDLGVSATHPRRRLICR